MSEFLTFLVPRMNYFVCNILIMLGLYGILAKTNYLKKIIGLNILQTAIILFFISIGAKKDATIPILTHHPDGGHDIVQAARYINPLPHVLMLTAIVVAVATLGAALAMTIKIYKAYQTIEEDRVLDSMTADTEPDTT